jgi:hypothetical protein
MEGEMAFKGVIRTGSTVEAELLLDHTASGPAFLLLGFGRPGGEPSGDGGTANPGGIAHAKQRLDARGRLEVGVDMSANSDTGVLVVSVDRQEKTRKNITGDTVWVYSVLEAAGPDTGAPT